MKVGDLVRWLHHHGAIYKIINEENGMFQIENYVSNYYGSKYWTKPNSLSLLTPEDIAKVVANIFKKHE